MATLNLTDAEIEWMAKVALLCAEIKPNRRRMELLGTIIGVAFFNEDDRPNCLRLRALLYEQGDTSE